MNNIFLSYSRHDTPVAQALAEALAAKGWNIWVDRSELQEGDAYDTQIEQAIAQTRIVLVLWSQHSVKSQWVRAEAAYALTKHKLLPISLDDCEPPLQFLHIQTLDFRSWLHDKNGQDFQHLTAILTRRLDESHAASPETDHQQPALARYAPAKPNFTKGRWPQLLARVGLRFPEKVIENEFRNYFGERTYVMGQFAIILAFATYVIYGVADMGSASAIMSTRFRYMVACPILLIFFGVSFTNLARRNSQLFIAIFAVVASACLYETVVLIGIETPFRIETGNGTMNFMLVLAFLGLLPLRVPSAILLGAVVSGMHALIMWRANMPIADTWLNYLHVSAAWTVACSIAYWRERSLRTSFASGFAY